MQLDISFAPLCPSISLDMKALHALAPLLSYRQIIFAYIIIDLSLLIVYVSKTFCKFNATQYTDLSAAVFTISLAFSCLAEFFFAMYSWNSSFSSSDISVGGTRLKLKHFTQQSCFRVWQLKLNCLNSCLYKCSNAQMLSLHCYL